MIFSTFLENDRAVIVTNERDTHGQAFPSFIAIENPDAEYFPNGLMIGWKHRKK